MLLHLLHDPSLATGWNDGKNCVKSNAKGVRLGFSAISRCLATVNFDFWKALRKSEQVLSKTARFAPVEVRLALWL